MQADSWSTSFMIVSISGVHDEKKAYDLGGAWKKPCYAPTEYCIQDPSLSGLVKACDFELRLKCIRDGTESLNKIPEHTGAFVQVLDQTVRYLVTPYAL